MMRERDRPANGRHEGQLDLRVDRAVVGDGELDRHDRHTPALALDDRRRCRRRGGGGTSWRRMRPSSSRTAGPGSSPSSSPRRRRRARYVAQRVGLATDPVLRRHQLGGEALVEGMGLDGLLQLGEHVARADPDLALEQLVQRGEAPLVELHGVRHEVGAVAEVVEGRASPPAEGGPQQRRRRARRRVRLPPPGRPPRRRRRRPATSPASKR